MGKFRKRPPPTVCLCVAKTRKSGGKMQILHRTLIYIFVFSRAFRFFSSSLQFGLFPCQTLPRRVHAAFMVPVLYIITPGGIPPRSFIITFFSWCLEVAVFWDPRLRPCSDDKRTFGGIRQGVLFSLFLSVSLFSHDGWGSRMPDANEPNHEEAIRRTLCCDSSLTLFTGAI